MKIEIKSRWDSSKTLLCGEYESIRDCLQKNREADLREANLREAKTTKRYIQISCIGSRKDQTTYCFEDDLIVCGCWQGSLKKFEERVKETHKDNKQYLAEYLGFIQYLRGLK